MKIREAAVFFLSHLEKCSRMNLQESRLKLRENGEKEQKCDPSTRKIRINSERKRKYL